MSLPPITLLALAKIRMDGDTQQRCETDQELIEEYAEILDMLPPIVVFFDGRDYWPGDGHHRIGAHILKKRSHINAYVYKGTERDAILHAVGPANKKHGRQLTPEDKRRRVWTLLSDPEWSEWPNTRIAAHTGVGESTVRLWRREWDEEHSQNANVRTIVVTTTSGQTYKRQIKRKAGAGQVGQRALSLADDMAEVADLLHQAYDLAEPHGKRAERVLYLIGKAVNKAETLAQKEAG